MSGRTRLDRTAVLYLIGSMVFGVLGQVVLKLAAADLDPAGHSVARPVSMVLTVVSNPRILAGLLLYASGTFFWLLVLSRVDLASAYPYTAANFILVLLASAILLHEWIRPLRLVGALLIAIGIVLFAREGGTRAAARESRAPAAGAGGRR